MTSSISLHPGPAVGFDQPFEMLSACHERVQRTLALLLRLDDHLRRHGLDEPARRAARDVQRYFDVAGPAHHEDEERHVLPRLRAAGAGDVAARLHADHAAMVDGWAAVRADLLALQARPVDPAAIAAVAVTRGDRWRAFAALYDAHIALEESVAFPRARQGLDDGTLAAMGQEMAARRRG